MIMISLADDDDEEEEDDDLSLTPTEPRQLSRATEVSKEQGADFPAGALEHSMKARAETKLAGKIGGLVRAHGAHRPAAAIAEESTKDQNKGFRPEGASDRSKGSFSTGAYLDKVPDCSEGRLDSTRQVWAHNTPCRAANLTLVVPI
jgi:hypothetical protein